MDQFTENATPLGLYDPQFEHDACGIGAVVDIKGRKSHQTVSDALSIVERLEHRAGKDAEGKTGDGVGILTRLPHALFARWAAEAGVSFTAQVEFPRHINIESADMCAILGNLLDNALEAARQVAQKEQRSIELTIRRINQMPYRLEQPEIRIGKSASNDICISDNPAVSRVHAIITRFDGDYRIQDNGSTNHTFVNGIVLRGAQEKLLSAGDRILLGNEEFIFKFQEM